MTHYPTSQQKAEVWKQYRAGRPIRTPVVVYANPRVVLADPSWNPDQFTFEQADLDPVVHIKVWLQFELWQRTVLNRCTDSPTELPDEWRVNLFVYNVFEAACFGAEVHYQPGQVPCTEPFLTDDTKHSIFEHDISRPLENPWIRSKLAFHAQMVKAAAGMRFEGRPVRVNPWGIYGSDGPVTAGCNLRGSDFLIDLVEDPDYAVRLMNFVIDAGIARRQAFWEYNNIPVAERGNGFADDSLACLSTQTLRDTLLPIYRRWYEAHPDPARTRGIHLCGNATRHFPILHEQLNVTVFDTGFPVDHGQIRQQLGDDVEILGGPEVQLLLSGTPDHVYARARDILTSGVRRGGRFILREGNNLPPLVPEANLAAMYQACLDHG